MSVYRRASSLFLQHVQKRGGHSWPGGSFWSEGTQTGRNGYLFGETPPPPGQARKWESWELPWYGTLGTAAILITFIAYGKPDTSLKTWAKPYALKELEEEDEIFAKYESDAKYAEKVKVALTSKGNHVDLYYDAVMLRNEYEILKRLHAEDGNPTALSLLPA